MSGDKSSAEEIPEKSVLQMEYDDLIRSMKTQIDVYNEEHNFLKRELQELLAENQILTAKINAEFKRRIRDDFQSDLPKVVESEMIINLKDQLELCKREREKSHELYQTSLKVVEKLEEEIRFYQENRMSGSKNEIIHSLPAVTVLEAKLKNTKEYLEMETSTREKLENENLRYQTEMAKLKINLEANVEVIDAMKDKEKELMKEHLKLEQEHALLNATYDCVLKSRDDLEGKMERYYNRIRELEQSNNEAKSKVEEALDIVDNAIAERDAANLREVQLQAEVNKLELCLQHVIEEAGKKVGTEVEEIKKKYDVNMREILKDVPDLRTELERKNQELKKMTTKCKKLEKVNAVKLDKEKISLIRGSETELTILESQLDSVYKELERLKVNYEDLLSEKKKTEDDLRTLNENYVDLSARKEAEENRLREEIDRLKCQIERRIGDLEESSKRSEYFVNQIRGLQTENRELSKVASKCNCDKLRAKMKKMDESRSIQINELEGHVESQMKINEKWKNEIKGITEKFEERIRQMKKDAEKLKAKNKKMVLQLTAAQKKTASLQRLP